MATNMSKKRKFVADGVFYAELNEVSPRPLSRSWRLPHKIRRLLHSVVLKRRYRPHTARSKQRRWHTLSLCFPYVRLIGWVQLLTQELAEEGYAGVEVRVTPLRTEIIISATRPQNVLGEKGQRIRELTSVVQKRCVT